MSSDELENWRSQFVTSSKDRKGLRYSPFCFTEHGVLMLSSVLNSDRAIAVNIQIIRVFTKIREILNDTMKMRLEIEEIKKKLDNQSKNIEVVFSYLDELLEKNTPANERQRIGYKK